MPLNLSTGADLVRAAPFQQRVAMAFYWVAREVIVEPKDTHGNELRVSFARSIVMQDLGQFTQYSAMVATDPRIVAAGPFPTTNLGLSAPTDDLIITAVRGMWNYLANVPAPN